MADTPTKEDEDILTILADYSDDLQHIRMRDGELPAIAALNRLKAHEQRIALEARIDEARVSSELHNIMKRQSRIDWSRARVDILQAERAQLKKKK